MPHETLSLAFGPALPTLGLPDLSDAFAGMLRGGIAQMPLTLTNAIIATAALSPRYFPDHPVTERRLAINTCLMSLDGAVLSGGPFCHGAGGPAARATRPRAVSARSSRFVVIEID